VIFQGGSKMTQALVADSIDIADGAGTEMALVAKGAPMMAVCESSSTFPFVAIGIGEKDWLVYRQRKYR
jgi:ABC-type nitrate/sulfonate/bicarbonate transport system substrate-binding protein